MNSTRFLSNIEQNLPEKYYSVPEHPTGREAINETGGNSFNLILLVSKV